MVVHFPLVLAVATPLIAIISVLRIRRGANAARAWSVVLALTALLAVSSFLAVRSGEAEEDKVEDVVGKNALHTHEESGERFLIFTIALFVITATGLARGSAGKVARSIGAAGSIAVLMAAVKVGEAGGELVYVHGAASAYQSLDNAQPQEMQNEKTNND
jgi:uncharacterized membrane protein